MGPGRDIYNMNDKEALWAIPKLAPDRTNWVTFKTRFLFTMAGCDLEGHFDGSDPAPLFPTYSIAGESRWTAVDKDKNQAYLALTKKWKHNEHVTCAQLAQVVSDSLMIWIQHASTVVDIWKTIIAEFDHKW